MSSTADCSADRPADVFTITHPFHPRHGQQYVLVSRRLGWGEDRVHYFDDNGKLGSMPAAWTSVAHTDLFSQASAGRSWFRVDDLLALAERVRPPQGRRQKRRRGVK
ncbi:MAG: DUF5372 family protein [Acidiferrobacter sp.]